MDGELRLVLAVFNEANHVEWERSGVAGVGDVVALTEIERHLRNIRLANYEISYAHQLGGEQLRSNLVLIGGADSNRVTRKIMDRLPLTFVFNDPDQNDVAMIDKTTGETRTPRTDKEKGLVSDQGIVVRAPNPFNGERQILILAGSYGYGSTAAARLVISSRFLRQPVARSRKNFEALFTTEVVEHAPQEAIIQEIRELRMS